MIVLEPTITHINIIQKEGRSEKQNQNIPSRINHCKHRHNLVINTPFVFYDL